MRANFVFLVNDLWRSNNLLPSSAKAAVSDLRFIIIQYLVVAGNPVLNRLLEQLIVHKATCYSLIRIYMYPGCSSYSVRAENMFQVKVLYIENIFYVWWFDVS